MCEKEKTEWEIPSDVYLEKNEKISREFIHSLELIYEPDAIILCMYKGRYKKYMEFGRCHFI